MSIAWPLIDLFFFDSRSLSFFSSISALCRNLRFMVANCMLGRAILGHRTNPTMFNVHNRVPCHRRVNARLLPPLELLSLIFLLYSPLSTSIPHQAVGHLPFKIDPRTEDVSVVKQDDKIRGDNWPFPSPQAPVEQMARQTCKNELMQMRYLVANVLELLSHLRCRRDGVVSEPLFSSFLML